MTQKSVPVRELMGSWPLAVPSAPVVSVRMVLSPLPMLTVDPASSLPVLSSLPFSRTEAALNGSTIVSRVALPGVTMTSWSSAVS
ncbi:hypothetical protein [Streptomyces maremycinicus]|uniref:hypothetical protein n=1 Tax=Streptomyces maremycinicus TaxID=1679753 RepID=UPI0007887101|nr:hypothetical protein [Streptomyces sp. NBRC 110468]